MTPPVVSRSLKNYCDDPSGLNSREFPNRSFPFRHGLQAVNMDGESGTNRLQRAEKIEMRRCRLPGD
jgi:hypothetical protein